LAESMPPPQVWTTSKNSFKSISFFRHKTHPNKHYESLIATTMPFIDRKVLLFRLMAKVKGKKINFIST